MKRVSNDRPSAPSAGYLVWHLLLKWRSELDRALAPLGITSAQYSLLASLYGALRSGRQPSQRELADFSGLEPMYVSKLSRTLERAGFLRRADHPDDPRALQLTLTALGNKTVLSGVETVRRLEQHRFAPLGGVHSERSIQFCETLQILLRQPDLAVKREGKSSRARPEIAGGGGNHTKARARAQRRSTPRT